MLLTKERQFQLSFSISLLSGLILGILYHPTWHQAVEGAQVLSGTVQYPYPTAFYLYLIHAWTLLHQIPALWMQWGLNEIGVSFLLSGLVGMLSFAALSYCAYALTEDPFLTAAIPFFYHYTNLLNYGPAYPVYLMGSTASYGVFGQSWMIFCIGSLALKRWRVAGFFLGLAPAIHPALSIWTYLILVGVYLLHRGCLKPLLKPFAAGMACTLISYYFYHQITSSFPLPKETLTPHQLGDFVRNWDSHRSPVPVMDLGVVIDGLGSVLAGFLFWRDRKFFPDSARFIFAVILIVGGLSAAAIAISHMPIESVPRLLLMLMPARILNFNIILIPLLILAALQRNPGFLSQAAFVLFIGLFPTFTKREGAVGDAAILFTLKFTLMVAVLHWQNVSGPRPYARFFRLTQISFFVFMILIWNVRSIYNIPHIKEDMRDWSNDSFYAEIYRGKGLLLLGPDYATMQMITRRPVLIDGGTLDLISYLPRLGLTIAEILQKIYGIDLFHPPEETGGIAILPATYSQALWESRSAEEWRRLAQEYKFTQILTSKWQLKLPKAAENEVSILYNAE